jgi:hypothetical protein
LEVKSVFRPDLLGLENCSKRKGQQEGHWKVREAGLCDPCAEDVQQSSRRVAESQRTAHSTRTV